MNSALPNRLFNRRVKTPAATVEAEESSRASLISHVLVASYCLVAVCAVLLFQEGDGLYLAFTSNQVALGHLDVYTYFTSTPSLHSLDTVMPPLYYLVTGAYFKLLLLLHLDPMTVSPANLYRTLFGHTGGSQFLLGMLLFKLPNIIALLIGLGVLWRFADHVGADRRLVSIIWLASPAMVVGTLMQTQNDVFPAVATAAALVAYKQKSPWWTMVLLGLAAAFKNYAYLLIPITALLLSRRSVLTAIKLGVVGMALPALVMLPFLNGAFIHRVLQAHDGASLLAAAHLGRAAVYLWILAYGALIFLAWSRSDRDIDVLDIGAIWLIALLSVFLLDWWFSQWTVWIIPIAAVLAAKDFRFLLLWTSLNVVILANLLINAPYNLDGAMLMPLFGQSVRPLPIYGSIFIYPSVLPATFGEIIYTGCMALFLGLAIRGFQWLLSRPATDINRQPVWASPNLWLAVAVAGPLAIVPYVGAMVAQHVVQ